MLNQFLNLYIFEKDTMKKKLLLLLILLINFSSSMYSLKSKNLLIPLKTNYHINIYFGIYKNPFINSIYKFYSRIVFVIPLEISIYVANEGTVSEIGYNDHDVNYIVVNHLNLYFKKCANLSEINCKVKFKVTNKN